MKADLTDLIEVSRKYGSDPDWVLVGGGNTSMKHEGAMFVKASGFELSTISAEGFVEMRLDALKSIWDKKYSADEDKREAEVLEDMMASRAEGQSSRPSVEALLHSLVKGRLVVHTHPSLINGLTCGREGEKILGDIFGDSALWVPLTKPGYILANEIKTRIDAAAAAGKPYPEMIFMQNHGLFVAGDTPADIERIQNKAVSALESRLKRKPAATVGAVDPELLSDFTAAAEKAWGRKLEARAAVNDDILAFSEDDSAFEPIRLPFNPDQIVYSGPGPLRIDDLNGLAQAVKAYTEFWKREPQAVLLRGKGVFTIGDTPKKADSALSLMIDTVKIAVYSESFGGALPMSDELIVFIRDWEVEQYRAKMSK